MAFLSGHRFGVLLPFASELEIAQAQVVWGRKMPQLVSKARLYDLAVTSPLIVLFTFAVAGTAIQVIREISGHAYSMQFALSLVVKGLGGIFAGLQVVLFIVRKLPISKLRNWWPRILAIIGANSALPFLMLPVATPTGVTNILSAVLMIGGITGSILVLSQLGRSFSITPQARGLVVSGPYRVLRHPLYLSEQFITVGMMLQYEQPWALLVCVVSVALQFPRIHYEEKVLSATFSAYGAYAKKTARLIPGIY
jgi:protein-S-isoprenylcysteine O-methyltransferase Ste14